MPEKTGNKKKRGESHKNETGSCFFTRLICYVTAMHPRPCFCCDVVLPQVIEVSCRFCNCSGFLVHFKEERKKKHQFLTIIRYVVISITTKEPKVPVIISPWTETLSTARSGGCCSCSFGSIDAWKKKKRNENEKERINPHAQEE
jgi:hypothetical protein